MDFQDFIRFSEEEVTYDDLRGDGFTDSKAAQWVQERRKFNELLQVTGEADVEWIKSGGRDHSTRTDE